MFSEHKSTIIERVQDYYDNKIDMCADIQEINLNQEARYQRLNAVMVAHGISEEDRRELMKMVDCTVDIKCCVTDLFVEMLLSMDIPPDLLEIAKANLSQDAYAQLVLLSKSMKNMRW